MRTSIARLRLCGAGPGGASPSRRCISVRIIAGVLLAVAGLLHYQRIGAKLESGRFEPAGFIIDRVAILTVLSGVMVAGYLVYTGLGL